jgi:hypothetical protein
MHKRVLDDMDAFSTEHRAKRMGAKPPSPEAVSDPGGPEGDMAAVADGEHSEPDVDEMGGPSDMDADDASGGMIAMDLSPEEAKVIEEMRAAKMGEGAKDDDMGGIDVAGLAAQLG